MRLYEFLENNIPAYKLLNVLSKYNNFNIKLSKTFHPYELPENNSKNDLMLDKKSVINSLSDNNLKISDLDKILQKYGWYISEVSTNYIHILKYNSYDNGYYDNYNNILHNLYFHVSNIKPSIILNKGLKALDSTDPNLDNTNSQSRGILYPNKRIYLWKLEQLSNAVKSDTNEKIERKLMQGLFSLIYGLGINEYGQYVYLITLPDSIKTHYDQEYGSDTPARYITQNIPPSYIKYIGTLDRLNTVVDKRNYKQMKQILRLTK